MERSQGQIHLGDDDFVEQMRGKLARREEDINKPRVQQRAPGPPLSAIHSQCESRDEEIRAGYENGAYSYQQMSKHDGVRFTTVGCIVDITESPWNPITGCTKVSPGCKHCYAERIAERLQAMGQRNYRHGFKLTLQPHMLNLPLQWRKPQRIFVNSMSDLFHKEVPTAYILRVFDIMRRAHWHQFQVLTKRSDNLRELDHLIDWPANVWMGVSVENEDYTSRIDDLRHSRARTKFLSIEPLLGPIRDLNLTGIDWVIVGGESGPKARPMRRDWVIDIRRQCSQTGVAFFFKQWGGANKKKTGRKLDGRTYDEMPSKPDDEIAQQSLSLSGGL